MNGSKNEGTLKQVSLRDYNDRTMALLQALETVSRDCKELRSQVIAAHTTNGEKMQALRRELRRTQYALGGLFFVALFYGLGVF